MQIKSFFFVGGKITSRIIQTQDKFSFVASQIQNKICSILRHRYKELTYQVSVQCDEKWKI